MNNLKNWGILEKKYKKMIYSNKYSSNILYKEILENYDKKSIKKY